MRWRVIIALALIAGPALAQAPYVSLRPVARPEARPGSVRVVQTPQTIPDTAPYISLRPVARPGSARVALQTPQFTSLTAPFTSLRPVARPTFRTAQTPRQQVLQDQPRRKPRLTRAERRAARKARRLQAKGAICGDPSIQGEVIGRVPGKLPGCGIDNAVRVRSISNVALSQQSVMSCTMANSLKSWIDNGLQPAVGGNGGGVARLKVAAGYACRTRNSRKGAKISEHAKGNAIDISEFQLRDGSEISVLKDWNNGPKGRALKRIHNSACGPFGTVLGPEYNRYHRDHFHLDVARYPGGSYCR
ncbi:RNA binding S1 domain protein [hydrothermal vent metagenome]|uniref:RNA binding S1 domain protein n=1 Tax=hydrothermal vent metagenome TaxID=652676 RepID=A0A3B0SHG9_9ZZZZ